MRLQAIGHLETPFATLADCPRNGHRLDPAPPCTACIDPAFAAGLADIAGFDHLILLYWLGAGNGPSLVVSPAFDRKPRGIFATRAPVRPNPIGLSVVAFDGFDGPLRLRVRYLDCLDGTALIDIKPYLKTTDSVPGATMGWLNGPTGA